MLGKIWHWVQHFAACAITVFVLKEMSADVSNYDSKNV